MTGWHPTTALAHVVYAAGFQYDASQDILISRGDAPLQSRAGFNWAYDNASAGLLMILDCERFYFTYDGKKWLIELWKGQYGLETGAEIGVYNAVDHTAQLAAAGQLTAGPAKIPRLSNARGAVHQAIQSATAQYHDPPKNQYACPAQNDWLPMSSTLRRNNTVLLRRSSHAHWWLTGFKWGVFTRNTHDLTLDVTITLKDATMCEIFRDAVTRIGYQVTDRGTYAIGFTFVKPKTTQPASRARSEDHVQAINERLVARYCALRSELKLSSNDPNGFDAATIGKFVVPNAKQGVVEAAKRIEHDLPVAAKKLHQAVDAKVGHEMSEVSKTAYADLLQFFEKGWRTGPSAAV